MFATGLQLVRTLAKQIPAYLYSGMPNRQVCNEDRGFVCDDTLRRSRCFPSVPQMHQPLGPWELGGGPLLWPQELKRHADALSTAAGGWEAVSREGCLGLHG